MIQCHIWFASVLPLFFLLKSIKSYIQLFYHVKGYCTYPLAIMLTLVTQFVNEVLYTSKNIKISSTQARQDDWGYLAILKHLVNMAEALKDQTHSSNTICR